MINITCDICKTKLEAGTYVTRKTWGTFPELGYIEHTIHVCCECDTKIDNFINSITVIGEICDKK